MFSYSYYIIAGNEKVEKSAKSLIENVGCQHREVTLFQHFSNTRLKAATEFDLRKCVWLKNLIHLTNYSKILRL